MPNSKKASKKKPQEKENAKAEAQNAAKTKVASNAAGRVFGTTQEEAEKAIVEMEQRITEALSTAFNRAFAAAKNWDASSHEQGLEIATPIVTILKSLTAQNLEPGGQAGRRDGFKHFANLQALVDAVSNSTGGTIRSADLNNAVAKEAQEEYVRNLHDFKIWISKRDKKKS